MFTRDTCTLRWLKETKYTVEINYHRLCGTNCSHKNLAKSELQNLFIVTFYGLRPYFEHFDEVTVQRCLKPINYPTLPTYVDN